MKMIVIVKRNSKNAKKGTLHVHRKLGQIDNLFLCYSKIWIGLFCKIDTHIENIISLHILSGIEKYLSTTNLQDRQTKLCVSDI